MMPDPGRGLPQHARQLGERSKRSPQEPQNIHRAWIGEQLYVLKGME